MKNKFYSLYVEEEGKSADLYLFGDICTYKFDESDVTPHDVAQELSRLDVDEIRVHINSYGGEVAAGWAIYNALKSHRAKVVTQVDGFACSIAAVIFAAGDERIMLDTSMVMIHNPWTSVTGNAEELRKEADTLETMGDRSAECFRKVLSVGEEELQLMLSNETWLDPAQALKIGLATSIRASEEADKPSQSARKFVFDKFLKEKSVENDPQKSQNEQTLVGKKFFNFKKGEDK